MITGKYLAAPLGLLVQFVLLAGIPLGALGWLGKGLLLQDRELETQRQADRVKNMANGLADQFDRALSAWAAAPDKLAAFPADSIFLLFDSRGILRQQGIRLPYYPTTPTEPEVSDRLFASAGALEFRQDDPGKAADAYRALASGHDPQVRAEALMRLARTLRGQQKIQDALAAYGELAALGEIRAAAEPAALLAAHERIALFRLIGDDRTAQREQASLASALSEGRFLIDRATFDLYAKSLPRMEPPKNIALAEAIEQWWPRWEKEMQGRAVEAAVEKSDGTAYATVWRKTSAGTAAMAGFVPPDPSAADNIAKRRNLLAGGFALMILIICAAGYFVFRAIHRELSVARLQSEFVSTVSHEFRTPLTAMRHLTEMLEEGDTPGDRLPQYYRALSKETRRLLALVESLLDFGRMQSGRRTYRMEETSATELAGLVVDEFRARAASTEHRLEWHAVPDPLPVRADREALALALRNLLDNAVKYSPEFSTVSVSVGRKDGLAGISVQDEGAGIPKQEQRDVFRKFVRGAAARDLNVKGTGIGLAMADQIVKAHGGRLELDSEPGRGSRFTILLPTEPERP